MEEEQEGDDEAEDDWKNESPEFFDSIAECV